MGQHASTPESLSGGGGTGQARSLVTSVENLIPLDILNIILHLLSSYDLKALACVNQNFYRFVNPLLWKSFEFHPYCGSRRRRRRELATACHAICRDPERSRSIGTFTARLGSVSLFHRLSGIHIRRLAQALGSMPNLTKLTLECEHQQQLGEVLAKPPNGRSWPFRLTTFHTMISILDHIHPFLQSQPSITEYEITEAYWHRIKGKNTWKPQPNTLLPNLKRFRGPNQYARPFLEDRSLDTLYIPGSSVTQGIQDLYPQYYLHSSARREELLRESSRTAARNVWMDMEYLLEDTYHYPLVMSIIYHISLPSVYSLKISSYFSPDYEALAPPLKMLPILECFEWCSLTYDLTIDVEWVTNFVLAFAKNCCTLRRITFSSDMLRRVWTRVPLDRSLVRKPSTEPTPIVLVDQAETAQDNDDTFSSSSSSDSSNGPAGPVLHVSSDPVALMSMDPICQPDSDWMWVMESIPVDFDLHVRAWEI
ncbi:hypothetical protein DL93DRAFT_2096815 [Clavulina sp. PMI_390]|nr:hypothetical protein DL93DRAFT_2096815 [Clavulina sp. PMI_390]